MTPIAERLAKYTTVRLTADLSQLTARERQMIPLLIDAARGMDEIYWQQAYGEREALLARSRTRSCAASSRSTTAPGTGWRATSPSSPASGAKPAGADSTRRT